jgi:hypothetical protein
MVAAARSTVSSRTSTGGCPHRQLTPNARIWHRHKTSRYPRPNVAQALYRRVSDFAVLVIVAGSAGGKSARPPSDLNPARRHRQSAVTPHQVRRSGWLSRTSPALTGRYPLAFCRSGVAMTRQLPKEGDARAHSEARQQLGVRDRRRRRVAGTSLHRLWAEGLGREVSSRRRLRRMRRATRPASSRTTADLVVRAPHSKGRRRSHADRPAGAGRRR